MSKSKMIVRKFIDRACHWTVVICFFTRVALSGISFFFPTLQWLAPNLRYAADGTHFAPVFGIAIFVALMFMFSAFCASQHPG